MKDERDWGYDYEFEEEAELGSRLTKLSILATAIGLLSLAAYLIKLVAVG